MKKFKLPGTDLEATRIALGCMTMGRTWNNEPLDEDTKKSAVVTIRTALEEGINFFDHADIYARGKSEEVFSFIWQEEPGLREKIILQSKCGIRFMNEPRQGDPQRYDFSYDHIISSVEGSLRRLKTDRLDLLLLHRPDPLVEPEEVAEAFDKLYQDGKVRYFGVSNHTGMQIDLLKKYLRQPLVVNQMELNILHPDLVEAGITTNQRKPLHQLRGEGTMEYCRIHGITMQAWSPMAKGLLTGKPALEDNELVENTYRRIREMAEEKNVSPEAIVIAWILRHPAKIQPIVGSTNSARIRACAEADQIELSREEWYTLFTAGRGAMVP
ncbi:MAG: aldo/keto reductase [Ignavibacteria bacterium]|jgi:predicted oxidoreductase|nr:aldo/keto reductase [Ignavibacteria bacterium]MCU7503949.1 aldo/keto reductase [Ignavibacteria bacterium]MCU7515830.1 aldo/keto reductase [Ignavibacteria bacterium]